MGDIRDIFRGDDIMSQSHPLPSNDSHTHIPKSPSVDPWRWTEYKSKYRPFSQYSYSSGSWHRNQPLDTTDGPSSWYAEVAERIHKAEEYKSRSRSSGIGETEYPSERNRLIWSNSVSALTLHDTVDSSAAHRRQKSRFHSLGPAFPLSKDNKPSSATVTKSANNKPARTSRSVSRRRPESKDVTDSKTTTSPTKPQATSPTKGAPKSAAKPSVKKETDSKDTKGSKPRAVVKPTPAKESDKAKEDKKWIKPVNNDTIDKPAAAAPVQKDTKETKPAEKIEKTQKPAEPLVKPLVSTAPSAKAEPAQPAAADATKKLEPTLISTAPAKPLEPKPAPVPQSVLQPVKVMAPQPVATPQATSATPNLIQPQAKPAEAKLVPEPAKSTDVKPLATPLVPSTAPSAAPKAAPVDPMAKSFIDHSTIGGGGGGAKTAPKPGDFSMARSRLDEFWAEGK